MARLLALLPQTARSRRIAQLVVVLLVVAVAGYITLRPRQAYALVRDTTLTVLAGKVEVWTAGGTGYVTVPVGTLSTPLKVGDRVRSGPDGHAVLTYFEGSTTEIEPNTAITVSQLQGAPGQSGSSSLRLAISETSGTTWNKVVKMVDPNAHFEVTTPSAVIAVRGTAFQVAVGTSSSGKVLTTVDAQEGIVSVSNQGRSVNVQEGQQSTVLQGQPPAPPAPAPPPANTLRIGLGSPANLFLCDALGRCIGFYQPAGVVVNTTPNSWYSGPGAEPELAGLPNPGGNYRLTLQASGKGGQIHLSLASLNGTTVLSQQSQVITVHSGQSATTAFNITLAPDGTISVSPLATFTFGGQAAPPKQPFAQLLVTALQRAKQQTTTTSTSTTAPPWLPVTGFKDAPTGTTITVLSLATSSSSAATTATQKTGTTTATTRTISSSTSSRATGGQQPAATTGASAPSTTSVSTTATLATSRQTATTTASTTATTISRSTTSTTTVRRLVTSAGTATATTGRNTAGRVLTGQQTAAPTSIVSASTNTATTSIQTTTATTVGARSQTSSSSTTASQTSTSASTSSSQPSSASVVSQSTSSTTSSSQQTPAPTETTTSSTTSQSATTSTQAVTSTTSTSQSATSSQTVTTTSTITSSTTTPPPTGAPAIAGQPGNATVLAGDTVTFTAVASGNPTPTVQWQASNDGGSTWVDEASNPASPSGALIQTQLSFQAQANENGDLVRAVFTNSLGTATTNAARLTVNSAPTFTSSNSTTFTAGTDGSFIITATGVPTPFFSETGALPNGVLLTSDGTLAGHPALGTAGSYNITIRASNGITPDATQSFTLIINSPPVCNTTPCSPA